MKHELKNRAVVAIVLVAGGDAVAVVVVEANSVARVHPWLVALKVGRGNGLREDCIERKRAKFKVQIDIGRRSPAGPVTSPYVRVRIRRFGRLSDQLPVKDGIPSKAK
jgi:hypothetical protein